MFEKEESLGLSVERLAWETALGFLSSCC